MIRIKFSQPHLSIKLFREQEIPDFTVVTGANGAGKTHFLQALDNGRLRVEGTSHGLIRLYNSTNFQASVEESSTPEAALKEKKQAATNFIQQQQQEITRLRNQLDSWQIVLPAENSIEDLFSDDEEAVKKILENSTLKGTTSAIAYLDGIKQLVTQTLARMDSSLGVNYTLASNVADKLNCHILRLKEKDLNRLLSPLTVGESLQFKLASQFSSWFAAYEYNKINRYYNTQEGKDFEYESDEKFYENHGYEPWDTANKILEDAELPYKFNRPSGTVFDLSGAYQLRLIDKESGDEVAIKELSSGERGLLALFSLRYQATLKDGIKHLPKILLLDEIDAHLHPSFTKIVLQILKENFVDQGIKIVLATHSPSTVALAESSGAEIFELTRVNKELRKISSSTASSILSSGFLSVFPDDQIIICEAIDDANYYQKVHNRLVQLELIPSSPALRFIPASNKANSGVGGGCAQAKQWAEKLSDLNLSKFRGLIDWDPRQDANTASENVTVIKRSALENYLLDPLTLLAILVDNGGASLFEMWTNTSQTSANLLQETAEILELMIGELERLLDLPQQTKIGVRYIGGLKIDISEEWQLERGHTLQEKIGEKLNKIPFIRETGKIIGTDGTSTKYIDYQTNKFSALIPTCLVETFTSLKSETGAIESPAPSS